MNIKSGVDMNCNNFRNWTLRKKLSLCFDLCAGTGQKRMHTSFFVLFLLHLIPLEKLHLHI